MQLDSSSLDVLIERFQEIREFTQNGRREFRNDRKTQDAVLCNLLLIAEASSGISEALESSGSSEDWQESYNRIDKVGHDYFNKDLDLIWEVVENHLSPLEDVIHRLRSRIGS
ncbi:MAG: DUF86 domain-containing protein [candidate division Zixibacteria bacterium]|nr:DUF86 domain-containing protein [candidate division Zixibacteria bacterium]